MITCRGSRDMTRPYNWTPTTITEMVAKPEYMGHTVNFRTFKESYKDKHSIDANPEDWLIFENMQEAIVDEDTWHMVQKIRQTKHRPVAQGEPNPLTGLVYCANCGAKMFNHRTKGYEKKDKDGNPTGKFTNAQNNYTCSTYSKAKSRFENCCTQHHVRNDVFRDLILTTLQYTSAYVKEHENEFIEKVRQTSILKNEADSKALSKKIGKTEKRLAELEEYLVSAKEQFDTAKSEAESADNFIALVHKYTDFSELTTPMIHEFIVQKLHQLIRMRLGTI